MQRTTLVDLDVVFRTLNGQCAVLNLLDGSLGAA